MTSPTYHRVQMDDRQIPTSLLNRHSEALEGVRDFWGEGAGFDFGIFGMPLQAPETFLAQIIGGDGSTPRKYSWLLWQGHDQDNVYAYAADPSEIMGGPGAPLDLWPAYENSNNPNVPVDGTAVVRLWRSSFGANYEFHWQPLAGKVAGAVTFTSAVIIASTGSVLYQTGSSATYQTGTTTTYQTGSVISNDATETYTSTHTSTFTSGSSVTSTSGSTVTANGLFQFPTSGALGTLPTGILSVPALTVAGTPTSTPAAGTYPLLWNAASGVLWAWSGSAWIAAGGAGGTVTSVSGTANQVAVATGTTTPVISLAGPHNYTTLTAHAVLLGNGTGVPAAATPGTAGRILTDQGASVDPAWVVVSGDATFTLGGVLTLAAAGTAGTYTKVTTDAKGRVSSGTTLATSDLPALSGLTAADVGLTDAVPEYNASAAANRSVSVERLLGFGLPSLCEGRLSGNSGQAVPTADVLPIGIIYFTPYRGNRVCVYDGTRWKLYVFAEMSLSLVMTSGKIYDVFLYDDAGTLRLELSAAWTNDTTRADALTTQDGVSVKSSDHTRRYVGTLRANGSNSTEDSAAKRFVWNAYNRTARKLKRSTSAAGYTYSTGSYRQVNADTAEKVEVVIGAAGDLVELTAVSYLTSTVGTSSNGVYTAIGYDSTTVDSADLRYLGGMVTEAANNMLASMRHYPGIGYHAYNWLEKGNGSGTQTWYPGNGGLSGSVLA